MSARLGMNEIAYESWKGKTFAQVTSKLQKNKIILGNGSTLIFGARPIPNYRREIVTNFTTDENGIHTCSGNQRTSLSVNQFEQPNGYLVYSTYNAANNGLDIGIDNVLDGKLIKTKNQLNELPGCNSGIDISNCLSTQNNALKRTRRSGILKKEYCSDTKQYLYSRHQTFKQCDTPYLQSGGDPTANPGSPEAVLNTYISGGCVIDQNGKVAKCSVMYKPNNFTYSQQGGVDSSTRLDRLKYDTLNTISGTYKGAYGEAMVDTLAYNVPSPGYNIKQIIGYPLTSVPVIEKDGNVRNCGYFRSRR
jgi:hypothetical protein